MKKTIMFIAITLAFYNHSIAQRGQGRGMGGHQQNQSEIKMQKFNASNAAGILIYDAEKIIKKLKVKDSDASYLINKAVNNYNQNINEIKFANTDKFNEISKLINLKRKEVMASGNREALKSVQEFAQTMLKPIKSQVNKHGKKLNSDFKEILSEKQFSKWLKYQKAKKRALKPKSMNSGGGGNSIGKGRGQASGKGKGCNR